MEKPIGKTKDTGCQFGIRKTYRLSSDDMWHFLFSEKGLRIWLGRIDGALELKKEFKTEKGVSGLVRVFKPNSHIRINWQKKNWTNISIVQLRVIGNKEKTTISFHQEKLVGSEQREEMKIYWNKVVHEISKEIEKEVSR